MTSNAMHVPCYPDFIDLDINLKDDLHPRLSLTFDGVSEFTFSGLYLFRKKYNYRISRNGEEGGFIISGEQIPQPEQYAPDPSAPHPSAPDNKNIIKKTFFMTPCAAPDNETLSSLFASHDYWKNISETVLLPIRENLEKSGIIFEEDRANFDYLYYRSELAELAGKKFHKKKNHVNNFLLSCPNHEQKPLTKDQIPAAEKILEQWREDSLRRNGNEGDYIAAKEALDLFDVLTLKGSIYYVDGEPAAYCLGESLSRGKMFAIHFEKADEKYKGIYQFVNQSFAASLPRFFTLINREQDLGSEGLRQSKMTYRPCGFVKKYKGVRHQ